jgi:phage shock protein PspC (stress-responsive transcriptional regulator)
MEPMSQTTVRPSLDKGFGPSSQPLSTPEIPAPNGATEPFDGTAVEGDVPAKRGFRLHRSRTDRMLGGVCGGLAESLDVDVTLLRIGLVALTVVGGGIGAVFYVAAWILTPEADAA